MNHADHSPVRVPPAHIVLVEPEIPNNTGSVGRTCVATGCALHLVHPLGFDIDEKACRRAGLDYWPRVDLTEHEDLAAYRRAMPLGRSWFFSARATRTLYEAPIQPGDHLVFGRESVGLPQDLLDAHPEHLVTIPLLAGERSLNLSNAVAVAVYEVVRKMIGSGSITVDSRGRLGVSSPEL